MERRILVLGGDASEVASLAAALRAAGYDPGAAQSLSEARSALQGTTFDVILIDVPLPDGSGLRFCYDLRETFGDRPVIIFISPDTRPSTHVTALQLGADDVVTKPVDQAELLARIAVHLERTSSRAA